MHLSLFLFIINFQTCASQPLNLTEGFISLPLNQSNLIIQRPYDVPEDQRYSFIDGVHKLFINGVHKLWVYCTDKPHTPPSKTKPRTEIRIHCILPVLQFEGYGYVPNGTYGVCIMQVFGARSQATTLAFTLNNDGVLKYEAAGHGEKTHYFKCRVYAQRNNSYYMESRWKEIKVFKKC
ncbi:hypothetical protein ACB092_02G137700 [Castanea dentata]